MTHQTFEPLAGQRILVVAFDFLVGLSISVYLKHLGAMAEGPLVNPEELAGHLTRFLPAPDLVVVQTAPDGVVPGHVRDALHGNRLASVIVNNPLQWEADLLADILGALRRPAILPN